MAQHEYYRVDLVVGMAGDEQTKGKLKTMDRFIELTKRRGELLNRIQISPVARLIDRFSGPAQKIEGTLGRLANKTVTVAVKAKDMTGGIINNLTSPLVLLGAGAGTASLLYPLKLAGDMEKAEIAFEFLAESAERGKKFLEDLVGFAAKTPFEFDFLREISTGIMGVYKDMFPDVEQRIKQTMRAITAFGDAAGYTGASMDRVKLSLLGFKQIAMIGTLSMEELRQVTENLGVPMSIIIKELGIAQEDLKELGSLGIPASKAMEAILRAFEKNYGGGMAKLSRTYFGLISTLKDTFSLVITSLGTGMLDPVKNVIADLTGEFDYTSDKYKAFQAKVEAGGKRIGEVFEKTYYKIKNFVGADVFRDADWGTKVGMILNEVVDVTTEWMDGPGKEALVKMGATMGELLGNAFITSFTNLMMEHPILRTVVMSYAGYRVGGTPGAIAGASASVVAEAPIQAVKAGERRAEAKMEKIRETGRVIDEFKVNPDKFKVEGGEIRQAEDRPKWDFIGRGWDAITKHAAGGVLTQPHLGMVAEAGPEVVIPLSSRMRSRALELLQQTGRYLGVKQYEIGGVAGLLPAGAYAGSAGGEINVYVGDTHVNINDIKEFDEDELALRVGRQIVYKVKKALENRT